MSESMHHSNRNPSSRRKKLRLSLMKIAEIVALLLLVFAILLFMYVYL
jgi:hypothetical protein